MPNQTTIYSLVDDYLCRTKREGGEREREGKRENKLINSINPSMHIHHVMLTPNACRKYSYTT